MDYNQTDHGYSQRAEDRVWPAHGKWRSLPCIVLLVVSFCMGAMLVRRSEDQLQLNAEVVQTWESSPVEKGSADYLHIIEAQGAR